MKYQGYLLGLIVVLGACATPERQQTTMLDAAQVRSLVSGNTLAGSTTSRAQFAVYYREDGTAVGELSEVRESGSWSIGDDGRLCVQFPAWGNVPAWGDSGEVCHQYSGSGNRYSYFREGELAGIVNEVSAGNPRGL